MTIFWTFKDEQLIETPLLLSYGKERFIDQEPNKTRGLCAALENQPEKLWVWMAQQHDIRLEYTSTRIELSKQDTGGEWQAIATGFRDEEVNNG